MDVIYERNVIYAALSSSRRDRHRAQIVEVAVVIAVVSDAVGDSAELAGQRTDMRHEALPLCRNAGTRFARVACIQAGDQQQWAEYVNELAEWDHAAGDGLTDA